MPEPTALLLCNLFIICKKLLHCVPAQIIAHDAGRKDKFLEADTPCLVAEEQRHGCKTALLLLRRNGLGKQGFIMIFQQILGNGTATCYVEHAVSLALQADRQLLQEMEKLQVHERKHQLVTEHPCHAGRLEKNDAIDNNLQIGKNGMLGIKMFEAAEIRPRRFYRFKIFFRILQKGTQG